MTEKDSHAKEYGDGRTTGYKRSIGDVEVYWRCGGIQAIGGVLTIWSSTVHMWMNTSDV